MQHFPNLLHLDICGSISHGDVLVMTDSNADNPLEAELVEVLEGLRHTPHIQELYVGGQSHP